jgi:cob(I)alamin adenosyltransferase
LGAGSAYWLPAGLAPAVFALVLVAFRLSPGRKGPQAQVTGPGGQNKGGNELKKDNIGKGYVQVYTGNCKGKTTAALGLAFRAMGRGLKTYVGQFMKGQKYAELKSAEMCRPHITIEQYGKDTLIHVKNPPEAEDVQMAREGLTRAKNAMLSGAYDIVVFDEINTAHFFHLITTEEMLEVISAKPDGVEVIFTGRYAPPEVIEAADLVTEMTEIKHYYEKGVPARDGIER